MFKKLHFFSFSTFSCVESLLKPHDSFVQGSDIYVIFNHLANTFIQRDMKMRKDKQFHTQEQQFKEISGAPQGSLLGPNNFGRRLDQSSSLRCVEREEHMMIVCSETGIVVVIVSLHNPVFPHTAHFKPAFM